LVFGSDDVDAFLQGFEKLGEARFVAARRRDVARENGHAVNLAVAHHGVDDAVKVVDAVALPEANLDHPGPVAVFEEARQVALKNVRPVAAAVLDELRKRVADDFLKGAADQIREAAVGCADFDVKAHGDEPDVNRVYPVAVALLRALDSGK